MDKFMNHKKGVTARLHPFFRYYKQKLSKNFIKKLKLSIYMGGCNGTISENNNRQTWVTRICVKISKKIRGNKCEKI